jgi:hypothetical protein
MALLEGKNSTERNKMIAAAVLGVVALVALYMAFGRSLFRGTTTTATAKSSPTPRPGVSPGINKNDAALPTADEQKFQFETTPVVYQPGGFAPDPGRNIFAFYEPPPPCRGDCPTPTPKPIEIRPATPTPTPPMIIAFVNPQSVYAGSNGFRLEVNGERFTPAARIYFNQTEVPTTYINAQRLISDIPANFIAQEGPRQVIVQTTDGKSYSDQFILTVQAPPRPGFQYIGMIGRKRYNNDTAYFLETDKKPPFGARLNDVVGGRFRLVDIGPTEVVFEDVNLGFRHRVQISKATATAGQPSRGFPGDGGFVPFDPSMQKEIPGIPSNIPRFVPQQPQNTNTKKPDKKEDVDDDGDGGR